MEHSPRNMVDGMPSLMCIKEMIQASRGIGAIAFLRKVQPGKCRIRSPAARCAAVSEVFAGQITELRRSGARGRRS